MISKTIGFRGTNHFQTHPYGKIIGNSWDIYYKWRLVWEIHLYMSIKLPVWEFIWLRKNYPNLLPSRKMDDKPTNLIPWDALAAVGVRCCKCIMLPPCHHAVPHFFRDDTLPFCWRMSGLHSTTRL